MFSLIYGWMNAPIINQKIIENTSSFYIKISFYSHENCQCGYSLKSKFNTRVNDKEKNPKINQTLTVSRFTTAKISV